MDIELTEDPAIPLLGIYSEDVPACNKNTCSTMFIAALFVIARSWKQPRCPSTEEWVQNMWFTFTMEYYSSIKDKGIMNFAGKWMKLENIIQHEVNQTLKTIHENTGRKPGAEAEGKEI